MLFTLSCLISASLAQNNSIIHIYSTEPSNNCYNNNPFTKEYCSGNGQCVINIEYDIYNNNNSIVNNSVKVMSNEYCYVTKDGMVLMIG